MPSRTRSTLLLPITLIAILALGSLPACRDEEPAQSTQDTSEEAFAPARVEAVSEPAVQTSPPAELETKTAKASPEDEEETLPESERLSEEALELAFQIEALRQQKQGQKDAAGDEDGDDGDDGDNGAEEDDDGAEEGGASIAVFSKPPADIFVDGKNTGFRTPKTLPIEPGQHDVRVRFDNKELSEKKVVKVKDGGRVRLTFQQSLASKSSTKKKKKVVTLQPALLILVTNFDKADATVNGLPYPEYFEDPKDEGMLLPAGGPYDVKVTYDGKSKDYTLSLKPYEKRYLVVELTGFKGAAAPAPARPSTPVKPPPTAKEEKPAAKEDEGSGKITVYSKPRGDIMIDGKSVGQRTPNTIDAEEGRHEVQVRYESGETSEPKIVRVRKGSRIKLFFREQNSK